MGSDAYGSHRGAMLIAEPPQSGDAQGKDVSGAVIMANMLRAFDSKGVALSPESTLGLYAQRLNNGSFAVAVRPPSDLLKAMDEVAADVSDPAPRARFLREHKGA